MMTVRFASGLSLTYNAANFITDGTRCHRILTRKDGDLVARVPLDAIVEFHRPSVISQRRATLDQAARLILNDAQDVSGYLLVKLKRKLSNYDARSRRWK